MSETAKCYVKCKEIDEGKKAFLELLKQMKGVRDKTFDFELEFRCSKRLFIDDIKYDFREMIDNGDFPFKDIMEEMVGL